MLPQGRPQLNTFSQVWTRSSIEVVITSTIGNRVVVMSGTWVQIPPSPPRRNGLCSIPIFLMWKIRPMLRHSSSFAKRHARLACLLASALADGAPSLPPFCEYACGEYLHVASTKCLPIFYWFLIHYSLNPILSVRGYIFCMGDIHAPGWYPAHRGWVYNYSFLYIINTNNNQLFL